MRDLPRELGCARNSDAARVAGGACCPKREMRAKSGPKRGSRPPRRSSSMRRMEHPRSPRNTSSPLARNSARERSPMPFTTTARTPRDSSVRTDDAQSPSICSVFVKTCRRSILPSRIATSVKHAQRPKCADNDASSPPGDLVANAIRPSITRPPASLSSQASHLPCQRRHPPVKPAGFRRAQNARRPHGPSGCQVHPRQGPPPRRATAPP